MAERLTLIVEEKGSRVVRRNITAIGAASKTAGTNVSFLTKALAGIAATAAVATLVAAGAAAIQLADALAEVSTLLDDTPGQMEELSSQTLILAQQFGSLPTEQAKAFYQVISAGAGDAATATEILTAANKLAVGGVTDVFTATDGLTSILNAYGDAAGSATDVSDAFFVAVKDGKTTVDQLSSSIGKVAPLAASAGVGLDELLAATAALTKGGISTSESVTGLRAIMASIVKPTSEATKLANSLGLEFNVAALETKGLAGFLEELTAKTGGSTDLMAQLFGGVEALVPILALTGGAAEDFGNSLDNMANKAGSTEVAFEKMANSPGFQIRRLIASISAEMIKLGNIVLPAITASARFLADNMNLIAAAAKGAIAALLILGGPAIISGLVAAAGAVKTLTIALAANPFGLIVVAIGTAIGLLSQLSDKLRISGTGLSTLGDVATVVWERITSGIQTVVDFFSFSFPELTGIAESVFGNLDLSFSGLVRAYAGYIDSIIGLFKGAFSAIVAIWGNLPAAFANLGVMAINGLIGIIESGINKIKGGVNDFLAFFGVEAGLVSTEFDRIAAEFEGSGQSVAEAFAEGFSSSTAVTDAVNSVFDEAEERAQARASDARLIALANEGTLADVTAPSTLPGTDPVIPGGGGGGGASASKELNDSISDRITLLERQKQLLEEMNGPLMDVQQTQLALKNLLDEGSISVDQFTQAMRSLNVEATSLDNTFQGGLANGLARIAEGANNIGQQMSNFVVDAFSSATDAIVEFARTGQINIRQFFQDLFSQLLKLAANQLFSQLLSGIGGGGGAAGGGIGQLLGGLLGFQNGGSFEVGGNNSTPDSQLVAFRATKGETVDVKTPGQQGQGGGGTTVVQSPPVNVAVVVDQKQIVGAFDNPEGESVIINMLERNSTTVKQIANS